MRRPRRCWGPLIANGANGGLFGNGWSGGLLIQDGLPGGSIITDNNPPKSVALQQLQQVVTISGLDQSTGSLHQLLVVDPAHAPRHFFGDADLQALPTLQVRTKSAASSSESNVPVSSHAVPRASTSTANLP